MSEFGIYYMHLQGAFIVPNGLVRDQWEHPWKVEQHFPIKPGQLTGMALIILFLFLI